MTLPSIEVIATISNPSEYKSRYKLYKFFEHDLHQQFVKVRLWTIELQHGMRPMQVTQSDGENHLQLWTSGLPGLIWYKENLQNIAVNYLTQKVPDWRYVAFVDADFKWEPDAFQKTVQALQHYDVVQMFSHIINLAPGGGIINKAVGTGFMYELLTGVIKPSCYNQWIGSPGGAWAFRRESLNKLGTALGSPWIDWGILGAGDHYFATAIMGLLKWNIDSRFSKGYQDSLFTWQANAIAGVKRNVGYVENAVRHMWHGRHADRKYGSRAEILIKYQFDPITDLRRDVSGVLQLVVDSERQQKLRDACRAYFFGRNEDATTI